MKKSENKIVKKPPMKFNQKEVFNYWAEQALKHGQSPSASWSDHMVIEMEIRKLTEYLTFGDRVLDIGCANGYSTIQLASQECIRIRGIDYVPEMIVQARSRLKRLVNKLSGKVDFKVGDITALDEPDAVYDKVITVRVLINLEDWSKQLEGLQECVRVLKPGGMLLLSEATLQGWKRLNAFRREWGLVDIPIPPFNRYLDRDKTVKAVSSSLKLITVVDFASTYYVGTRVLKPLLVKALGADIDIGDPHMEWNRWFAQLPAYGDYGTQKLFVFKKR